MDTQIFTENGKYLMLAFDHRDSFKKFINRDDPNSVTYEEAVQAKTGIINSLKGHFSGILIDQEYGLESYKSLSITKPFLLPVEESGYKLVNNERLNNLIYKSVDIKNLGASGIKVLIYFNPNLESARLQLETAKKALADAHENDLPLFLEIVTYQNEDSEGVLKSVKYFLDNGVVPDIFKLEFPGSDYISQKITSLLGKTPWILLTRGADYTLFKEQLSISCENGCRGFLAGRSLWQEYFENQEPEAQDHFLNTTLPSRFEEIKKIVLES